MHRCTSSAIYKRSPPFAPAATLCLEQASFPRGTVDHMVSEHTTPGKDQRHVEEATPFAHLLCSTSLNLEQGSQLDSHMDKEQPPG